MCMKLKLLLPCALSMDQLKLSAYAVRKFDQKYMCSRIESLLCYAKGIDILASDIPSFVELFIIEYNTWFTAKLLDHPNLNDINDHIILYTGIDVRYMDYVVNVKKVWHSDISLIPALFGKAGSIQWILDHKLPMHEDTAAYLCFSGNFHCVDACWHFIQSHMSKAEFIHAMLKLIKYEQYTSVDAILEYIMKRSKGWSLDEYASVALDHPHLYTTCMFFMTRLQECISSKLTLRFCCNDYELGKTLQSKHKILIFQHLDDTNVIEIQHHFSRDHIVAYRSMYYIVKNTCAIPADVIDNILIDYLF